MRILISIFLITITVTATGQDTLKSAKLKSWEDFFKTRYDKYIGIKFPDFIVTKTNLSTFSNRDFANKVVFINFWFAQCPPCIIEIEGLNKMFNLLKDKSDFLFISFTFDPIETIENSIKKYDIQYKVIHLDREKCDRLNFNNGYPTNIIIDKNGIIRYFTTGGVLKVEEATKSIMTTLYPKILKIF